MNARKIVACLALSVTLQSGCATVFQGRQQEIEIAPQTEGASAVLDDGTRYSTPSRIYVNRKHSHVLRVEKDGFAPEVVKIERGGLSGLLWGNILGGVLLGWMNANLQGAGAGFGVGVTYALLPTGFDFLTGAAYRLKPDRINVKLRALGEPP